MANARFDDDETIYTYKNPNGGTVYVNGRQRIPTAFQQKALKVDLSDISLNGPIGEDLRRVVDTQYEAVLASDECRANSGGAGGFLSRA